MSDPYGQWRPGDSQDGPDDDDVTPVDGTSVDWSDATHLKPTPPGPAHRGPAHAVTAPLARPPAHQVAGRRSPGEVLRDAVRSHRDAPAATRVAMQLIGLAILLLVSAGAMFLLLRDRGGSDLAAAPTAGESRVTVTTDPPTTNPPTTAAPTTTTSTTTSTTTTVAPATVPPTTLPPTTLPPTTLPPTTAAPPTTAPPTTSPGNQVRYDDCWDAQRAGALPLFEGDPGYRSRLDRDGDGQACNSWRDWH